MNMLSIQADPNKVPELPAEPSVGYWQTVGRRMLRDKVAMAAALGLVAGLETIKGTVRGEDAVAAIVGQRPLVSIPYIELPEETARRQRLRKRVLIIGITVLLALIAIVHLFVMPLDLLTYKLLNRLS